MIIPASNEGDRFVSDLEFIGFQKRINFVTLKELHASTFNSNYNTIGGNNI